MWSNFWRLRLAVTVCIGSSAVIFQFWPHVPLVTEGEQTIRWDDRLRLNLPASYNGNVTTNAQRLRPFPEGSSDASANVSAIILNWSRFQNVRDIVTLLCSVDDAISEIVVWNNNPHPLS